MTALLIVDETITDPDLFETYRQQVLPTIEKFGGRFLVRGGAMDVLETGTDWRPGRMVIIEFPSMETLRRWYDSPDYAPVREIRFQSAKATLVAIEGAS